MEEDNRRIIKAVVVVGAVFSLFFIGLLFFIISLFSLWRVPYDPFMVWVGLVLFSPLGFSTLGLYKRLGGSLTSDSFMSAVFLSVGVVLTALIIIATIASYNGSSGLSGALAGAVTVWIMLLLPMLATNLFIACLGFYFIADREEKESLGAKIKTWGVMSSVLAFLVGLILLSLVYPHRALPETIGHTGFGAVKPIDHISFEAGQLDIVFVSAVGSSVSLTVTPVPQGATSPETTGWVPTGDQVRVQFGANNTLAGLCPDGASSYEVTLEVNYTNQLTGEKRSDTGRIWGPCS